MSLVTDEMLSRLQRMFGEPRTNDVDGYLDEFERALKGFSRDVLIRATNELIDTAEKPFWPTVGEAKAACKRASSHFASLTRMKDAFTREPDLPPPTPEEAARATALVQAAALAMSSQKESEKPLPDVSREAFERYRQSV